jgi:hypothetical protein
MDWAHKTAASYRYKESDFCVQRDVGGCTQQKTTDANIPAGGSNLFEIVVCPELQSCLALELKALKSSLVLKRGCGQFGRIQYIAALFAILRIIHGALYSDL